MKSSAKGKPPDHIQKKEDHLAPTGIEQNNNPANDHEPGANLTHGELQHRLDLYSRIGGNMDQYFKVQAIKQKYLEEIKEKEASRSKSDVHYGQGIRSGLPHMRHEAIKEMRDRSDQPFRDEVAKEAKSYYSENNSLSKYFKENKPDKGVTRSMFIKTKNKGIDRER